MTTSSKANAFDKERFSTASASLALKTPGCTWSIELSRPRMIVLAELINLGMRVFFNIARGYTIRVRGQTDRSASLHPASHGVINRMCE